MTTMNAPVAVVTGAARGIGAATAVLLASGGWKVVLVDSCADEAAAGYAMATRAELDATVALCGEAIGVISDVRDQVGLDMAVAEAVDRYGGLDAAVACAGVIAGGPNAWDLDEATWEVLLAVNLTGVWRLARAAVPELLRRPGTAQGSFRRRQLSCGIGRPPPARRLRRRQARGPRPRPQPRRRARRRGRDGQCRGTRLDTHGHPRRQRGDLRAVGPGGVPLPPSRRATARAGRDRGGDRVLVQRGGERRHGSCGARGRRDDGSLSRTGGKSSAGTVSTRRRRSGESHVKRRNIRGVIVFD